MTSSTAQLTSDLIRAASVSPNDAGCQALLASRLEAIDFNVEHMPFEDVSNFWAVHGIGAPHLVFAGHTDVVPPGPEAEWTTPPFSPVIDGEYLFGRGAADMKGSLAAMVVASERFVAQHPQHAGSLAFLITSDEEADAINGTVRVVDALRQRGTHIDWCVVGEPSSTDVLGDVVRVGRRGSLNGRLSIKGVQGHVAYPDQADNPIHRAMPALAALTKERWDDGNDDFPPTSMQISNIGAGTGVNNVIPGELIADFNFRFSPESTESSLKERTTAILDHYQLNYAMDWRLSGNPFHTRGGELIPAVADSIAHVMNVTTELSTSGGTSDGRFIARAGTEVVELGPCNRTIHKINECVRLTDLELLADIYYHLMVRLLAR